MLAILKFLLTVQKNLLTARLLITELISTYIILIISSLKSEIYRLNSNFKLKLRRETLKYLV